VKARRFQSVPQAVTAGAAVEPRKLAVISVFSRELAESSNVEAMTRALITEAAALAFDAAIFSSNADDGAHPAGLLYNVTPLVPTAGGGQAAMMGDLSALAGALATAGGGLNPVIVANSPQAMTLQLFTGPNFKTPVLPSSQVPAKTVIMVEASSLVSGFAAVPEFETSSVSLMHYEDSAPGDINSGGTAAVPVRSTFQTDTFALKMILRGSWAMRAAGHVQFITGATW